MSKSPLKHTKGIVGEKGKEPRVANGQ